MILGANPSKNKEIKFYTMLELRIFEEYMLKFFYEMLFSGGESASDPVATQVPLPLQSTPQQCLSAPPAQYGQQGRTQSVDQSCRANYVSPENRNI